MSHRDICPNCGQMYTLHNEARCQQNSNLLKNSLKQVAVKELQLDVQKWQISVNQGNEIIKELEAKLAIATSALDEINFHEGRYIKNSKEEITLYFKITKEALEKIK